MHADFVNKVDLCILCLAIKKKKKKIPEFYCNQLPLGISHHLSDNFHFGKEFLLRVRFLDSACSPGESHPWSSHPLPPAVCSHLLPCARSGSWLTSWCAGWAHWSSGKLLLLPVWWADSTQQVGRWLSIWAGAKEEIGPGGLQRGGQMWPTL